MHFFKPKQPILQRKKLLLSSEELSLVRCWRIKTLEKFNLCGVYTCVDQAMLIWGVVSGIIFISAQFLPLSWIDQAVFWSIITFIGVMLMNLLTYSWTVSERISWLLYSWNLLMVLGIVITDYAIASNWGFMLAHLCDLWLIVSAIGYGLTGWMIRSKAFFLGAIIHTGTAFILPWFSGWQFAITGLVMMSNLLIFSEGQWDRLLPREVEQYLSFKGKKVVSLSSCFLLANQILVKILKSIIHVFWGLKTLFILSVFLIAKNSFMAQVNN